MKIIVKDMINNRYYEIVFAGTIIIFKLLVAVEKNLQSPHCADLKKRASQ